MIKFDVDPQLKRDRFDFTGEPLIEEDIESIEVERAVVEDWHPQIKERPVTLKEMRQIEEEIGKATRKFFQRQKNWVLKNWEELLPSSVKKQKDWDDWESKFADEIEKPLSKALGLGGKVAQEELGKIVDWSLKNPRAIKFLKEHSLKLAKQINDTTRESIRDSLAKGVELGEGKAELAKRVQAILADERQWRCDTIAQTETMRAYNEGSIQLYKEGNIKKKRWSNGQPGACEICDRLDGEIADIDGAFTGGYYVPQDAHPNCRCSIIGVVE